MYRINPKLIDIHTGKNVTHFQGEKKRITKTNFKQTQMLELANKDFKAAILTMLNYKNQNKVIKN